MAEPRFHRVTLNIPAYSPGGALPNPDQAVVLLDGQPLRGLTEVSIVSGVGMATQVQVRFYAEIDGEIEVLTAVIPKKPEPSEDAQRHDLN